jgi:catechol 2,3-dioxygenase-like lactoylglutathione lyase family enzyme
MADYFSGFDLNIRVEDEEDGNLPSDLNDGNGNHLLLVPFCFLLLCARWQPTVGSQRQQRFHVAELEDGDGNTEFHLAEHEDDDGDVFFYLNEPLLEHGNGMFFSCWT